MLRAQGRFFWPLSLSFAKPVALAAENAQCFEQDLRVTIQARGWRSAMGGQRRYLPLQDDISSTALWYQREPHVPFPLLPERNDLEVI